MSTHDESLIDKVKGALGFGDDRRHDRSIDEQQPHEHLEHESVAERPDGWAGVEDALTDDPTTPGADVANRPAGPDYGAADDGAPDLGAGDVAPGGRFDESGFGTGATDATGATGAVEDDIERARRDEGAY